MKAMFLNRMMVLMAGMRMPAESAEPYNGLVAWLSIVRLQSYQAMFFHRASKAEAQGKGFPLVHIQDCHGIHEVGKTIHQRHDALHTSPEINTLVKPIQQECPLYNNIGKENQQAHTDQEGRVAEKRSFRKQQVVDGRYAQDDDGKGINDIEIEGQVLGQVAAQEGIDQPDRYKQEADQVKEPAALLKQA
ncbi:MAG: hypothetical protein ACXVJ5_12895 [Flavisolibacter sp.]